MGLLKQIKDLEKRLEGNLKEKKRKKIMRALAIKLDSYSLSGGILGLESIGTSVINFSPKFLHPFEKLVTLKKDLDNLNFKD